MIVWADAPRHGPDRPFPSTRFVPGRGMPRPVRDSDEHDFWRGVDLYHAGYLWEAHEEWEELWKESTDPVRREFLQGLIQVAAMLIKRHTGHERGEATLKRRASERLARVPSVYHGIDVAAVRDAMARGDAPRLVRHSD